MPVEGMEGVWTGTEAIFYGGYAQADESPGVAWNPTTRTWRMLPAVGRDWIDNPEMVWTGDRVVVYSGYPDRLLLFDPDTDSWTESAAIPITPTQRFGAAWTGNDLIMWGGHATYSDGGTTSQGALYNPATDTWTIMAESPLTARCDHTLTWTGEIAIVLGGIETCGQPDVIARGDAAVYDVVENEWRALASLKPPTTSGFRPPPSAGWSTAANFVTPGSGPRSASAPPGWTNTSPATRFGSRGGPDESSGPEKTVRR